MEKTVFDAFKNVFGGDGSNGSADGSIDGSADGMTDRSADGNTNRSADRMTDRSADGNTNRSADRSADVYASGPVCCFAPGRVNLIGEHTDYNGGHVFPCALTLGTYGVCRKRNDRIIRIGSVNFPETGVIETSLDDMAPGTDRGWEAYVKGVIWAFMKRESSAAGCATGGYTNDSNAAGGVIDSGLDIMIGGNLPAGAGLSSSASVEVLIGVMLRKQFGLDVSNEEIALIGQQAENEYVGMKCGIMDQFASAMGKADSAIYLDTATLEYEYVPLNLGSRKLVRVLYRNNRYRPDKI